MSVTRVCVNCSAPLGAPHSNCIKGVEGVVHEDQTVPKPVLNDPLLPGEEQDPTPFQGEHE